MFRLAFASVLFLAAVSAAQDFPVAPRNNVITGSGTQFQITGSDYLDVGLDSDVPVKITMESLESFVRLVFEKSADYDQAAITISGLEPGVTYYHYEDSRDGYQEWVADSDGAYSYMQDLTADHHVMIQRLRSTIIIKTTPDGLTGAFYSSGGAVPSDVIHHDGAGLFKLMQTITEEINVDADQVILDGNGHALHGPVTDPATGEQFRLANGIWVTGAGVTVRNMAISGCVDGLVVDNGDCRAIDNRFDGCDRGIITIDRSPWGENCEFIGNYMNNCSIYGMTVGAVHGKAIGNVAENCLVGIEIKAGGVGMRVEGNLARYCRANIVLYLVDQGWPYPTPVPEDTLVFRNNLTVDPMPQDKISFVIVGTTSLYVYRNVYISTTGEPLRTVLDNDVVVYRPLPVGGNFWSDHTSPDLDNDGIVDEPYVISDHVFIAVDQLPRVFPLATSQYIESAYSGQRAPNGWYTSDVSVAFDAPNADVLQWSEDGLSWTDYSSPIEFMEDGLHYVHVRALDGNGEILEQGFGAARINRNPLGISIDETCASPDCAPGAQSGWYLAESLPVTVTVSDAAALTSLDISVDNGATWTSYPSAPVTVDIVGEQTHTVIARAYQTNAAASEQSATYSLDVTAPAIVQSDITVTAASCQGATASYAPAVSDNVDPAPAVSISPASGSQFPIGQTAVTVAAEDAAGNAATHSFTVTVVDVDSDGDGVGDCNDGCPADPDKVEPGDCGCGAPDLDENNNGISDCLESGAESIDFEDYQIDAALDGQDSWSFHWLTHSVSPEAYMVRQGDGRTVCRIDTDNLTEYVRDMPEMSGQFELRWEWKASSSGAKLNFGPADELTSNNNNYRAMRARVIMGDGSFGFKGSSWISPVGDVSWNANTWYYMRMSCDLSTNRFSVWVSENADRGDERLLVDNASMGGSGPISRLMMKCDFGDGLVDVDAIQWGE
jgi:hypothetical protein